MPATERLGFASVKDVGLGHTGAGKALAHGAHKGMHTLGHLVLGVPLATGAVALISQWEHGEEVKRIGAEYSTEITSLTGRKKVTDKDVELAAKYNPVIKEAVDRSKKKRNMSIGVTLITAAATIAVMPLLGLGVIGTAVVGGAAFFGLEHLLSKAGEKALHLEEPGIKDVVKGNAKQSKLSVSSQVTYLAHLQGEGKAIHQEQVMTLLAAANPGIDKEIQTRYGEKFGDLDASRKQDAMRRYGEQLGLEKWTTALNDRTARAQELAFAAYGQASSRSEAVATTNRMGFLRSQVSGAVPGYNPPAQETAWRRRIDSERQQQAAAMGVA